MTDDSPPPPEFPGTDRNSFLNLAGALEGGLAIAAVGLAWLFRIDLWAGTSFDFLALGRCLAALLPLLALFAVTYRWPIGPLREIKRILLEVLGPSIAACRWYDLVLLAGLAGLGEELLFRGVVQQGLDGWAGRGSGLIAAAVIFGLCHAITPTYALLAAAIGLYLGGMLYVWEPPNLLLPIFVHAVYDLVAFLVIRADYRRREQLRNSRD